MKNILETECVTKAFKGHAAVNGVSLQVPECCVYGLLGPNGAGKSTILKMLTGILRPTSGKVIFAGHPWSRKDLAETGALVETPPVYENLTAWENLKVRALILGIADERIREVLRLVDLEDTGKKKAGAFSLGMKQRLGIILIFSVFVSLFLGAEYSDGTIRNKITAGHTRSSIYLSQFIVSAAACLTVYLICLGTSALLGFILLGGTDMPLTTILLYCVTGVLMCAADAAVFTLITMTAGNKAAGAVICLLTVIFLAVGAEVVYVPLSEEEYYYQPRAVYEAMQEKNGTSVVIGAESGTDEENDMVKIPNPLYISGQKRKVFEFLLDCDPVGQAVQLGSLELERPLNVIIYDITEIVICCAAGMLLFYKKDLK